MGAKISFSDEIREAIANAKKSRNQIAIETGIDKATISRFVHDKGGLSIAGLDKIAKCLGLTVVVRKPNRRSDVER